MCLQALAFERLLLVVKTQPVTTNPPPHPRLAELEPVNENLAVSYPVRSSDAHQRVPLEPLFHIDTEAQAVAQPMSIDSASDLPSIQAQTQTHAVDGNRPAVDPGPGKELTLAQQSLADAANSSEENGADKAAFVSPIRPDNPAQVRPPC